MATLSEVISNATNVQSLVAQLNTAVAEATAVGVTVGLSLEYGMVQGPNDVAPAASKNPTGITAAVSLPFPLPTE